ncbi:MAG: flippase activity-associated protein Agl23, partial [bacterium]
MVFRFMISIEQRGDPVKETAPKTIKLTQIGLLIFGIFLVAAFLRLFQLSDMAYHHDESLHAYYSFNLYNNSRADYHYDPTYHGPFLYHFGALIFFLFGDSDFTGRLPFVLFGMLMLYLILRLRPIIGTAGVVFTLVAVTLSPTLTYFSRFARNDIYIATESLAIAVFALDYFRTKKPASLIWMLFFLGLMYCTKENSLMMGFVLCSYVVFYGIHYVLCRPKEMRRIALRAVVVDYSPFVKSLIIYGLYSFFSFFYSKFIMDQIDWSKIPDTLELGKINAQMSLYLSEHPGFTRMWVFFALIASVVAFAGLWYARRRVTAGQSDRPQGKERWEGIAREYYPLVVGWAIVVALFCVLFTTLLYNRGGLKAGLVDYYSYWIGQQSRPRIAGPTSFYIPRLLLYETLAVLFGIAAYIYYLVRGIGWGWFLSSQVVLFGALKQFYAFVGNHESFRANFAGHILEFFLFVALGGLVIAGYKIIRLALKTPAREEGAPLSPATPVGDVDGFRSFLVYWSVSAIVIYSILHEKVPWLLTHQALPLCLLAGTFAGDLWNLLGRGAARKAVMAAFCVLAIYSLRANVLLNFYNPDNPREIMVYTQSAREVVQVRNEVDHIAFLLGKDKFMARRSNERSRYQNEAAEPLVAMKGDAEWPYYWYFRHYSVSGGIPGKPLPPVVIVDLNMETRMQTLAGGNYTVRRYPIRAWWPPYGKTSWPFDAINDQ